MTTHLDHAATDRLIKVLGPLGSDHAGERAAAGAKAHALLRSHGLTWREIIQAPPIVPQLESPDDPDWRRMAETCKAHRRGLNPRERKFILAIIKWRTTPSPKQMIWLVNIFERLTAGEGGMAG